MLVKFGLNAKKFHSTVADVVSEEIFQSGPAGNGKTESMFKYSTENNEWR